MNNYKWQTQNRAHVEENRVWPCANKQPQYAWLFRAHLHSSALS